MAADPVALPPGFKLDESPSLPAGFKLDQPEPQEGDLATVGKGIARGALNVAQMYPDVIPNAIDLAVALPRLAADYHPRTSEQRRYAHRNDVLSQAQQEAEFRRDAAAPHGDLPFNPSDMLGATINRITQEAFDLKNRGAEWLSTLGEILGGSVAGGGLAGGAKTLGGRAALNVALPAAGGALGQAVGGKPGEIIGSVVAPLAPTAIVGAARRAVRTPQDIARINANVAQIEAEGATPSLGQAMTGTRGARAAQGSEATIAQSPGGVGPMADFTAAQQQALVDQKTAAVRRLGGVVEKDVVGEKVAKTIAPYLQAQSRTYENYNNQIGQAFKPGDQVRVGNYQQALDDLSTKKSDVKASVEALLGTKVDELQSALGRDAGLRPAQIVPTGVLSPTGAPITRTIPAITEANLSFQGLKDLRSAIGQKLASPGLVADIGTGELKKLYGALSEDMLAAAKAKGPGYGMLVERQNKFWSEHMDRVENFLNKAANKAYEPEKIIGWATSGAGEGPTRLAELRKTISDPQIWKQIATTAAEDLGKVGGNGPWTSAKFVQEYQRMDPKARNVLFGVGGFQQDLDRIVEAQKLMTQGSKAFGNPPATGAAVARQGVLMGSVYATVAATLGLATGGTGTALVGALLSPAAMVASNNLLARHVFTNPEVARWVAQSTSIPADRLAIHLTRLAGLAQHAPDQATQQAATQLYSAIQTQQAPEQVPPNTLGARRG